MSCSTKVVSVGLTETVTLEERLERGKGVRSADIALLSEEHSERGYSQCKGTEAGAGLDIKRIRRPALAGVAQ